MILHSIFALAASIGFGVLFNIRGKKLLLAGIGGGLAWFIYLLSLSLWTSSLAAFFISTIVAASYSEIIAKITNAPVSTFIICGIIPIVPGGGMYYTILSVILGKVDEAVNFGIKTLASSGTIAVAIFTVSIIGRIIDNLRQRNKA
jgi:uncharacterized membrane protein YjjB (DUF3815 family)